MIKGLTSPCVERLSLFCTLKRCSFKPVVEQYSLVYKEDKFLVLVSLPWLLRVSQ